MGDLHKGMNPDSVSNAVRCLICLNTFRGQPVASPQHCDHFYCLDCITEWAKITNSCPVDRQKFTVLYQRSCIERTFQKIIRVKPPDSQELMEDERFEALTVCEECGRSDRRHVMLLCIACDSRFHITCLSPPLATVPAEDWFCQECATEDIHTNDSFSREESEIAEAEMMDLLSQFIPTSGRLRPSTLAQRAASVPTRRSARVRQHGSRTHRTLPHTVQHVPRYLLKSSRTNSEDATTSSLILNTKKRGRIDTYKNTRRQKTDKSDPV